MAPRCEHTAKVLMYGTRSQRISKHTAKVLMYGTRSQRISKFYQHTPCLSVNGITHYLPLISEPRKLCHYPIVCP